MSDKPFISEIGSVEKLIDMGDGTFSRRAVTMLGGTPISANAVSGGNTAMTLTIPAVAGKTFYLTGFWISGAGATAASNITVTYTGMQGGTSYDGLSIPAGATVQVSWAMPAQPYPWAAAASNSSVTISIPGFGSGNTAAAAHAVGYYA